MRYAFSSFRMIVASLIGGGIVGVLLLSYPVAAASPTYTVSDGKITIKETDYGTMTIPKGQTKSSNHGSCYGTSSSASVGVTSYSVYVHISQGTRSAIDNGNPPASLTYTASPSSPTTASTCNKGGTAKYVPPADMADPKGDDTAVNAATQSLLGQKLGLRDNKKYRGNLNESEATAAISECIDVAVAKATPPTNKDFADCYAGKTGSSAKDIKDYLDEYGYSIVDAVDTGEDARDELLGTEDEEDKSCGSEVEGIGWITCPILGAVTKLNDGMWLIVSQLITSDPLKQNGSYYDIWTTIRNIANALLVVGFIVIVYAQLTGIGLSNYGIKKMMPRLIIAAILINLSYFIVSIAVDIANIIGSAIYDMLNAESAKLKMADAFNWEGLVGMILAGSGFAIGAVVIAAANGGIAVMLLLLLPAALVGLLGFFAALVTLMFRQAIIPLLAILAPLAFVAYLLPNTESLFTKWRKMFTSMLLLYPIAATLFAGMELAGRVIAVGGGQEGKVFAFLTGLIVMSAPLFMLPFLAKQSGAMLGAINGKLQGLAGKAKKPFAEWNKGNVDKARSRYDAQAIRPGGKGKPMLRDRVRSMRRNSQYRQRKNELISAAYGKQADAKFNEKFADEAEGLAAGLGGSESVAGRYIDTIGATKASQAEEEEVKQILTKFKSKNPAGEGAIKAADTGLREAIAGGQVAKARAMQQYLISSGGPGTKALNDVYSDSSISGPDGALNKGMDKEKGVEGEMYRSLSADGLNSGVKSQSAALDKYFTTGSGSNFKDIKNDSDTYNKLNAVELASQKDLGKLIDKKKITADMAAGIMTSDAAVSKLSLENKDKVIDLAQHSKYNVQTPSSNQNSNQNGP